jgi:anaerobic selenocysteine-containing dehydrogenase
MQAGDWVDIESLSDDGIRRQVKRFMLVEYNIPRGCLAAYFPETNGLVPLEFCRTPARRPRNRFRVLASQTSCYEGRLSAY